MQLLRPRSQRLARYLCAQAGYEPKILYEGESAELIGESVGHGPGVSFVSQARFQFFQHRPDFFGRTGRGSALCCPGEQLLHPHGLLAHPDGGYRSQGFPQWFLQGAVGSPVLLSCAERPQSPRQQARRALFMSRPHREAGHQELIELSPLPGAGTAPTVGRYRSGSSPLSGGEVMASSRAAVMLSVQRTRIAPLGNQKSRVPG